MPTAPRRAFSLLELVVVIAIITVLMGILVVGVGKLQTSAKRRQTEQVLANCQAMFGDWEAYSRQIFSREAMACPQNVTAALNTGGYTQYGRYGDAELFMQDVMYHLKTMPTNAAALAKMPADEIGSGLPAADAAVSTSFSPPYYAYNYASRIAVAGVAPAPTTYYICIQSIMTGAVGPLPPDPAYWLSEAPVYAQTSPGPPPVTTYTLAQPIPLPLDGWGNPIIFVPYALGSGVALTSTQIPIAPAGALEAAGTTFQAKSPDGRPFFASAGPDGDFSQGDDNLYSFEH